jgi:hypothetical protein
MKQRTVQVSCRSCKVFLSLPAMSGPTTQPSPRAGWHRRRLQLKRSLTWPVSVVRELTSIDAIVTLLPSNRRKSLARAASAFT